MLEQLGRFTYRARWYVLGIWLAVLVVAAFIAPKVTSVLKGGGYTIGNSQSVQAYNDLHRAYGYRALTFTVVFSANSGSTRSHLIPIATSFRRQAQGLLGKSFSIGKPLTTPDHALAFERIYSSPQEDFGAHFADRLRKILPHGTIHGYLTGTAAIFHDMELVSNEDLQRVELVTLPIAAIVLLFVFGSVVASATPVLMAPVSVTLSLALIYLIGKRVEMSIFVLNTASMLGLGIAIDYSLFMVNRFREELQLGRDLETAVGRTVATSGRSILVSATVVAIGFYALTLSGVQMLRSLGIGGSIVTVFSLLVATTLLPAILSILGPRINLFPVLPPKVSVRGFWRAVSMWVMRRPIPIIAVVAVLIAVLAAPAFHLKAGIPGPEILPSSVDSRAGNDLLDQHLGYANHSPVIAVIERESAPVSSAQSTAFTVIDRICTSPDVVGLSTVPVPNSPKQIISCRQTLSKLQNPRAGALKQARRVAEKQRVALLSVFLRSNPSSSVAEHYVSALRGQPPIPGYRILIGGQTAGQMDFNNFLYSKFPFVVLFVVVTIFLVLLVAFRSLLLALKAVVMNIFSVLAAYGVVVFAFQDGHLARILGFTVVGNVDSIVPVLLFCVLFGISTDYEVFLLTRVQEEYLRTGNNKESVARGLEVTGRVITSAAVVMIVVFGAFSFARLVVIKEVGLGLALAVLVDATLIRALLVPALMRLLGKWNWWLPFVGFLAPAERERKVETSKTPAAG